MEGRKLNLLPSLQMRKPCSYSYFSYPIITGLLLISTMCGKSPEPLPTPDIPTIPTDSFSVPEGIVLELVQTEIGGSPSNYFSKIQPTFLSSGHLASVKFTQRNYQSDSTTAYTTNSQTTYKYDKEGYLIFRSTTTVAEKSSLPERVVKEKFEYQSGRLNKIISTFNLDENGRVVPDYSLISSFEYDAQGKLISYKKVDKNSIELERDLYGYDSKGQINLCNEVNAKELTIVDYTFVDGRIVKDVVKRNGITWETSESEYDAEGQTIRYTVKYPTGVSFWKTYKYDNKKAPYSFSPLFLVHTFPSNSGLGLFEYLLFKGHPKNPLPSGFEIHNLVSEQNSYGDSESYTYKYNSGGYPIETVYKIYNATQKTTKDGKRLYTYF